MSRPFDILVIDDEHVIIDAVTRLCSSAGWIVDTALDADTGLKKLSRNTYRLVICDIMMPEMDGFQFLEEMKARHIGTPTIVTTGYSTVENAVRSLSSGGIDYLAKPFTEEELISTVQRGLNYAGITQSSSDPQGSPPRIRCPDTYYRLGYSAWATMEADGSLKIGATDLFLRTIGAIRRVELLRPNSELIQGNACAHFETDDQLVHGMLSPMSGNIVERNESLVEDHRVLEKDPYSRGWIYTMIPSDLEYELKHLTPCGSDTT